MSRSSFLHPASRLCSSPAVHRRCRLHCGPPHSAETPWYHPARYPSAHTPAYPCRESPDYCPVSLARRIPPLSVAVVASPSTGVRLLSQAALFSRSFQIPTRAYVLVSEGEGSAHEQLT